MDNETGRQAQESAWNPGVGPGIPGEFRALETIFRPECAFTSASEIDELVAMTGLPHEELTVFRPRRLVLHEIIIRVTADIAVAEGDEEAVGEAGRFVFDADIGAGLAIDDQIDLAPAE